MGGIGRDADPEARTNGEKVSDILEAGQTVPLAMAHSILDVLGFTGRVMKIIQEHYDGSVDYQAQLICDELGVDPEADV
jgi:hypothetical protein